MYGDLRGDDGLRRALARDINGVYGVREGGKDVGEDEIALTAGCNLVSPRRRRAVEEERELMGCAGVLRYDGYAR